MSNVFKTNLVIFTIPPGGTFYFTIEYGSRAITLSLYGRNLYIMGLREPHETFEIKERNEKRKSYMSGEKIKILPFKKNYRFLAPKGDVINVRLGLFALLEAFEVLHKCCGETQGVKQAVSAFAVHLCEAGRLQSVLKDVCEISLERTMETLDSRSPNSFWINKYGNCGGQEMKRVSCMKEGKTPPVLKHYGNDKVTEAQILNQIRIFPRDGYDEGFFEHEPMPLEATENDSVLAAYQDWLRNSKGVKSSGSHSRSNKQGKVRAFQLEEVPMS